MAEAADTVVIAIDDSKFSNKAFDWYFGHMHRANNKIILVHCMEMPSVPSRDSWEKQTKEGKEKSRAILDGFTEKLQAHGVTPNFVMDFEKPGEMICQVAEKESANVIVMGTRGMSKLRRTLLGSVSNYVLNHANCPVLVVRPPKDDE